MKILFLSLLSIIFCVIAFPQDRANTTFGKVSNEDFLLPNSAVIDSNTNAVILYNIGSTNFIGNEKRSFSYVYKIHSRTRIINDKASDLFIVKIRLYGFKEDKDKLSDLKAATYNIENGKIQTATLDEKDVFEDKLNPYVSDKKFTFPAARKGSIIEYSYTITSYHAADIPAWDFQNFGSPCLYSEFKAVFPDALRFLTIRYGLDSFSAVKVSQVKNNRYTLGDLTVVSNDIMGFWAMKDVPAFAPENYMGSPKDYLDKIEFSLAKEYNGEDVVDRSATWQSVTDQLLDTHYFGAAVDKESSVNLLSTAETITAGDKDPADFARHIYYYVRDNFTCFPDDEIYAGEDLYTINKKK
ncbi:MAG TPA: DUF3857 domain-containing protein, partial [Chitinophagaceae bacterium]|nr:DUF3857 domain-containing protein [Chitinophagaceae bacterium]